MRRNCSTGSSTIPQTDVIGLYLEGLAGGEQLIRALRRADGRKPVVLLVGGTSAQGSRAVASHTGAMATGAGIWGSDRGTAGVTLVSALEDLIGCLAYLQRWAGELSDPEPAVLVVGPGGGASVLTTDACDRAGLRLAPSPVRCSTTAQARLRRGHEPGQPAGDSARARPRRPTASPACSSRCSPVRTTPTSCCTSTSPPTTATDRPTCSRWRISSAAPAASTPHQPACAGLAQRRGRPGAGRRSRRGRLPRGPAPRLHHARSAAVRAIAASNVSTAPAERERRPT